MFAEDGNHDREPPPMPRKLSLGRAYRRVVAKFRHRGDHTTTADYSRYDADSPVQAELRREMRKGKGTWEAEQGGPMGPRGGGF
jgi:hypothetical protein